MSTTCKVTNCKEATVGRGWCRRHYMQWSRHGKVTPFDFKHGLLKTRFHGSWRGMKYRTTHPNRYYSDRGISISERWKTFAFFKEDMYEGYLKHVEKFGAKNTTIERINNSKGYSKGNCKWATHAEQWRNKRSSRIINYRGRRLTLSEWSRIVGISQRSLHYRLSKWSLKKSLETPRLTNKTRVQFIRGLPRKRFSDAI